MRQHPDDKLVTLYAGEGGVVAAWERHETGERYGGVYRYADQDAVLIGEGINPFAFFAEIGRV